MSFISKLSKSLRSLDWVKKKLLFLQIQNRDAEKNEGKDLKKEPIKTDDKEKGEGDSKKDEKSSDRKSTPAKKKL